MRAVDTNILVYAHRSDVPQHFIAQKILSDLVDSGAVWFVAWPSIYEFLRVVTHPKIFKAPSTRKIALEVVEKLAQHSGVTFLGHGSAHLEKLAVLGTATEAIGNLFFDVQIAGILLEHGITEIVTNDGDFLRFKGLTVLNPFS